MSRVKALKEGSGCGQGILGTLRGTAVFRDVGSVSKEAECLKKRWFNIRITRAV